MKKTIKITFVICFLAGLLAFLVEGNNNGKYTKNLLTENTKALAQVKPIRTSTGTIYADCYGVGNFYCPDGTYVEFVTMKPSTK